MAADRGHPVNQRKDTHQIGPRLVHPAAIHQDARIVGIGARRGERLVELMAQRCRHLAKGGKLARLHQICLCLPAFGNLGLKLLVQTCQFLRAFLDPPFQIGPRRLLHLQALIQTQSALPQDKAKQRHQAQGQNRQNSGDARGPLRGFGVDQHMNAPTGCLHRQIALDIFPCAPGPTNRDQMQPVAVHVRDNLKIADLPIGIAPRGLHPGLVGHRQRAQGLKQPIAAAGEEHDPIGIGDQNRIIAPAPRLFNRIKVDLEHQHPRDLVHNPDRRAKVIPPFAAGGAKREVAAQTAVHRLIEIGAKGKVPANERSVAGMVRCGDRQPIAVHQIDVRGAQQDLYPL